MSSQVTATDHILLVEPFNGGSHKQLVDMLCKEIPGIVSVTLPGKKWHWKARVSALYISQIIPKSDDYRILFASSVLNLCELVSLRPDLSSLKKILYFHENQLAYPKQKTKERDYQYGYNNITSCMVADVVLFNSNYNRDSFLEAVDAYLNRIPYEKPKNIAEQIHSKCHVLNFPIVFPNIEDVKDSLIKGIDYKCTTTTTSMADNSSQSDTDGEVACKRLCLEEIADKTGMEGNQGDDSSDKMEKGNQASKTRKPLHIVWPHRWEHDKNPGMMFRVMNRLVEVGCDFKLSVIGEAYSEIPDVFLENKDKLESRIEHWGFIESKIKYNQILYEADCVISTADHEFFGVAMLEAVHLGCYPLCPNKLVYPEIFPRECLYNTETQLYKRLREFCRKPYLVRQSTIKLNTDQYSWEHLKPQFTKYLTLDENLT